MKVLFALYFASLVIFVAGDRQVNTDRVECYSDDDDCGSGVCREGSFNKTVGFCDCNSKYINAVVAGETVACDYKQKGKLETFLLSFFVGPLGVDWFYLARGDVGYNVAGAFKLITIGGLGIWWLVDWIRILDDSFSDGNGVSLSDW